jgi:hypothetical protein
MEVIGAILGFGGAAAKLRLAATKYLVDFLRR